MGTHTERRHAPEHASSRETIYRDPRNTIVGCPVAGPRSAMKKLSLLLIVVVAAVLGGCEKERCEHCANKQVAATPTPAKSLAPWQPVNAGFEGCAHGCGLRLPGP